MDNSYSAIYKYLTGTYVDQLNHHPVLQAFKGELNFDNYL